MDNLTSYQKEIVLQIAGHYLMMEGTDPDLLITGKILLEASHHHIDNLTSYQKEMVLQIAGLYLMMEGTDPDLLTTGKILLKASHL